MEFNAFTRAIASVESSLLSVYWIAGHCFQFNLCKARLFLDWRFALFTDI